MSDKNLVNIIIPIYKEKISNEERISLRQCIKILSAHPITLICPKKLDLSFYYNEYPNFQVEYFSNLYFKDLHGYNRLMLSLVFYKRFKRYKYLLIYQLDAWVFRDELDYWCKQGYDFIGAPWIGMDLFSWFQTGWYPKRLYDFHRFLAKGKYMCKVGNGGFSLRKVKTCLLNIRLFKGTSSKWRANEDSFFSHYVKALNPFFRIASLKTALRFSFELNPEKAFEMNNFNLPFGCHAWSRQEALYEGNYAFWKKIIKENGES